MLYEVITTGAKLAVNPSLLEKLSIPSSTPAAIDLILKWSWSSGTNGKLIERDREQKLSLRSAVIYGDYLACSKFDVTDKLGKIKVPTLVIVGDNDKMTSIDLNKQLENGIKNAKLTIIPNGGHMVMLEKPNAVADAAFNFLQSLLFSKAFATSLAIARLRRRCPKPTESCVITSYSIHYTKLYEF